MPSIRWDDEEPENEYEGEYTTTETIDNGIGGTVEVTNHRNGHRTIHWGGMAGDQEYDEIGEEC